MSYLDGQSGIAKLLSTATISAIVAIIGIMLKSFAKKDAAKSTGNIMLGFAILMIGMQTMSGSVAPLKESPVFIKMLTSFTHPILGILFGLIITVILQSASASVGVLQALSVTGALSFSSVFPMLMGVGIGASCPVLLSAIGSNRSAKQTSMSYLINEVISTIIGSVAFLIMHLTLSDSFMGTIMSPFSIAFVNTLYRLATVIPLLPFTKLIEKLATLSVPNHEDDEEEEEDEFALLEERFLAYPAIAINQSHKAIISMALACSKNLDRAFKLYDNFSEKTYNHMKLREDKIDKYEDKIGRYLMQLTGIKLSNELTRDVSQYLHSIGDVERIGDHAYDIAKVFKNLVSSNIRFSYIAEGEMKVLESSTKNIVKLTIDMFDRGDVNLAYQIEPFKDVIKDLCDELKTRHINRLSDGICNFEVGFNFSELLTDCERIAAHCSNIAVCLIEMVNHEYDMHDYINEYAHEKNGMYDKYFSAFKHQYRLKD